jgi:hypothetical protein
VEFLTGFQHSDGSRAVQWLGSPHLDVAVVVTNHHPVPAFSSQCPAPWVDLDQELNLAIQYAS